MQRSKEKQGMAVILFGCVLTATLLVDNSANAQEHVIFVSDFYQENITAYGSCQGPWYLRYVSSSDPAYDIAEWLDYSSSADIIATEVNNCSSAGNSKTEYQYYINNIWQNFLNRTHAVPGNHDYYDDAEGFKWYFGNQTYHSFTKTAGSTVWKIIGLDSNLDGNEMDDQLDWLQDELQNEDCTIAYFHHPRFSSGSRHGSNAEMQPIWEMLADNDVEVAISGHDHIYERFSPMDADGNLDSNGLIQVVAGTGGAGLSGFGTAESNSVVRIANTYGIVHFMLGQGGYSGHFMDRDGSYIDVFGASCH